MNGNDNKPTNGMNGHSHLKERNVDVLLKQNHEKMEKLKELIKDIYDEKIHDEIYLLRYCLSNDKLDKAEKSIRFTMEYRKKNDSWLKDAVNGEKSAPNYDTIIKYSCSSIHKSKSDDGGPIVIVRSNLSHPKKLMDMVNEEQMCNFLVFQKEICWMACDELTRKNRKITKMLAVNDMNGVSLLSNDKRFFKSLGDSSKIAENLYPQLLEKNIVVNPPTMFKVIMSVASVFMSKKSLSKMVTCKGNMAKQNIKQCPYASKMIKEEDIPTFLGGKCDCTPGCVANVPNKPNEKK